MVEYPRPSEEELKGHVPTPGPLADRMVARLFDGREPGSGDRILYPGVGTGPFVAAVERYCGERDLPVPAGVGIELDPDLLAEARERHADLHLLERDFLNDVSDLGSFEYVVGNPPYVPIEGLDEDEKQRYRRRFDTATGRFDLYILFFEQALDLLAGGGRLVFVNTTPGKTHIMRRDGSEATVTLPDDGSSWASRIRGGDAGIESSVTLDDICQRVSCGVATGADGVFVQSRDEVPPQLLGEWTYPTVSGKQLRINDGPESESVFVCPYDEAGRLPPESELGAYGDWAELHRQQLEDRSCVEKGKRAWYGWHENPAMADILQPKVLCKDITDEPEFWADRSGEVVPRHSVYYIVPEEFGETIQSTLV